MLMPATKHCFCGSVFSICKKTSSFKLFQNSFIILARSGPYYESSNTCNYYFNIIFLLFWIVKSLISADNKSKKYNVRSPEGTSELVLLLYHLFQICKWPSFKGVGFTVRVSMSYVKHVKSGHNHSQYYCFCWQCFDLWSLSC